MIKNFDKKSNWDTKYVPNFIVVRLICTRQLEVSDPMGRLLKENISDVHKILPAEFIVSFLTDEQIFARKGKYINDPSTLKDVSVIDTFLHDCFQNIRLRHQPSYNVPLRYCTKTCVYTCAAIVRLARLKYIVPLF